MEAPEYLHGGLCRGGGSQYPADKQGDQFAVEDLLDFSNEDDDEEEPIVSDVHADEGGSHASGGSCGDSSSASMIIAVDSCNSSLSGYGAQFSGEFSLSGDLCEPVVLIPLSFFFLEFSSDLISPPKFLKKKLEKKKIKIQIIAPLQFKQTYA